MRPTYLRKILLQLAATGALGTGKGPNGGYVLARSPRAITLLDVMSEPTNFITPTDDVTLACSKTMLTRSTMARSVKNEAEQ